MTQIVDIKKRIYNLQKMLIQISIDQNDVDKKIFNEILDSLKIARKKLKNISKK